MWSTVNRLIIGVAVLMLNTNANADRTFYPTYPGTDIRDVNKPGYVQQGNDIYQTYPGTDIPDVNKPGLHRDGNTLYQTYQGTNIPDVSKPGLVFDPLNGGRD